ncbi:MAG: CDP-alcohol phosphatidyltransferase family protein [Chromatiales bacterium]|nr:CDP-alcohol phosphatidyltransferase family protein [Chromatiales bacterium]
MGQDNPKTVLRHLPNAISMARLLSTPLLIWLAWSQKERLFAWLLIIALASDGLDGLLARAFEWTSRLGSLLDSIADAALMLAAAYGVWVFHHQVYADYGVVIWTVLVLWGLQHLLALFRYRRLASFHTGLVRWAVLIFAIFVVVLFLWGFNAWLFYVSVLFSVAAVLEEVAMVLLIPEWSPNLRGGLREALRRRRSQ